MRVFITSTPDELQRYQVAACEVARGLGLEPVQRDPSVGRGLDPVTACGRQVAAADFLLAIIGWRRGQVPSPELGGDGLRPWSYWEVTSAFERGRPVVVLMAAKSWRPEVRETDPRAQAVMRDFRGELEPLALFFEALAGGDDLAAFREQVRRQLVAGRRAIAGQAQSPGSELPARAQLRRWPSPEMPERPYPVLLPYSHPALMAGREHEIDLIRRQLRMPVPIVGLYGLSGIGKSSFLAAGLVPVLRAEGHPVAFDRHPGEPGIAGRLLGDLLVAKAGDSGLFELGDDELPAFVQGLLAVRCLAGGPAILVVDQFEDLLRSPADRRARAAMGALLAASVQRQPGVEGPLCRWLLAYRQEFHGELFLWLGEVLRDALAEGSPRADELPSDLSGPERFLGWPLSALGTPAPGSKDRAAAATRVFRAAIEKPLALRGDAGALRYPWRFASAGAERLAGAFGEARAARPAAPLAPELQVVLAHLLDQAGEPPAGGVAVIEVPDEPGDLIDRALEDHLRRGLDAAFPVGGAEARTAKARALLALRELADVHGRRDQGLPVESLAQAIGPVAYGREVLQKLATPQTRLVLLEEHADGWRYVLAHDRMAEVIARLVDGEGYYAELGIDSDLLGLRRFIRLQSELFRSGEVAQATEVPAGHFQRIEKHADALLWDERRQSWWESCRRRRRADRRRAMLRHGIAALVIGLVALGAGSLAYRQRWLKERLERIVVGEPEAAFAALDDLASRGYATDSRAAWRQRDNPFEVFERGLGGVGEAERGAAMLRVAELAVSLLAETPEGRISESWDPEDPRWIASIAWALDAFGVRAPVLAQKAKSLREEVLKPLWRRQEQPPAPESDDPNWADLPGGTFWMGSRASEGRGESEPRHQVTISAFRLINHEVTNAEYRLLKPEHAGRGDLPATEMTWYEAYTYAAWFGGRLPTEAEWEYAARAGCAFAFCKYDGSEATVSEVAWWIGTAESGEDGEPGLMPVKQLEPNPWGLFDIHGNAWEMTADWIDLYSQQPQIDPTGPTQSAYGYRSMRGGSVRKRVRYVAAAGRGILRVDRRGEDVGFRIVLPDPELSLRKAER